jgi:hypothetical protein
MFKRHRPNDWAGASVAPMLVSAILIVSMPRNALSQCVTPTPAPCPQSVCEGDDPNHNTADAAVLGWDGDHDAVYAHMDGSYRIRDGKSATISFGIYNNPQSLTWYNESGYLPCLTTQFERPNEQCTIKISSFADKVTIPLNLGNDYVVIYTRVSINNHGSTTQTLCPSPQVNASQLPGCPTPSPSPAGTPVPLATPRACTIKQNQTVTFDYAIAADRFGSGYQWPSDTNLANAGGWDSHYSHMASYWNNKLAGIVNITQLPDPTLINAYKAGYIYTHIVKDGSCLKTGEGPGYDSIFNHDEIGILANLFVLGDFTGAQTFLPNLGGGNGADDANYKYSWPWALYLEKTGDPAGLVTTYFDCIKAKAHSIDTDRTGPGGIIKATIAVDNLGFWTVDNWSALMGLQAYEYICSRLGNGPEKTWAANEYNSLLTAVNNVLSSTMTSNNINYIPPAMLESNALRDPKDAVWASMFSFGRWAWDGYLFGANQSGVSLTNIDNTYDAGFLAGWAAGLAPHNFGFFPQFWPLGYSTVYNAGSASGALRGEKYRSEGIYGYQFMIANGQSGPFCWHESFSDLLTPSPWAGHHPTYGFYDSPHMWGQANATKVLIDSLIAEKTDGSVIIGRGVPNAWVANGQVVELSNFPIASNTRMGFNLQGIASNQIRLTLTGATPSGGTVLDLRAFKNNIQSVTAGTPNPTEGTVTLPPGTTTTIVTLSNPNPTPIPTPTPLPTPSYTPPVGGNLIEAESGTLTGCYVQADPNASGGFRVDGIDANGDNVAFTNFRGTSVIKIRYASPNTGTFGLYVNGTRVVSIPITSTGSWGTYAEKTLNVTIPTGATVKFQYDSGDVAINLDCIVIGLIEMENGTLGGGARDWPDYYASAGHSIIMDSPGASVTFMNNFPAANELALRYSTYDLSHTTQLTLSVNNASQTLTLPHNRGGGGSTYAYTDAGVDVSIPAGATVTFQQNTGAALYDCIYLAQKLEAENAALTGCYTYLDTYASNGKAVGGINAPNYNVSFTSVQGGSRLVFRYATANSYGLMSLYINNQLRSYVFFPTTSSWGWTPTSYADKVLATDIPPGATVTLQYDNGDSAVNLDYIRVY